MKESTIVLVRRFRRALFFATALATCAMHRPALAGIVYLNRCVAGCTVSAGPDDAANHVSSILTSNSTAPEFAYSDATFDQVAACVHHVLLPFDIHVVITDPGLAPRREIMLTTTSQTLGFPPGLAEIPRTPATRWRTQSLSCSPRHWLATWTRFANPLRTTLGFSMAWST